MSFPLFFLSYEDDPDNVCKNPEEGETEETQNVRKTNIFHLQFFPRVKTNIFYIKFSQGPTTISYFQFFQGPVNIFYIHFFLKGQVAEGTAAAAGETAAAAGTAAAAAAGETAAGAAAAAEGIAAAGEGGSASSVDAAAGDPKNETTTGNPKNETTTKAPESSSKSSNNLNFRKILRTNGASKHLGFSFLLDPLLNDIYENTKGDSLRNNFFEGFQVELDFLLILEVLRSWFILRTSLQR